MTHEEQNEHRVRAFYQATVPGHREALRGLQAPQVVYDLPEGMPSAFHNRTVYCRCPTRWVSGNEELTRWTTAGLRAGCAGVLLLLCTSLATANFTGPVVSVLDGDTIEVLHNTHPERVRLIGIDCPALRAI